MKVNKAKCDIQEEVPEEEETAWMLKCERMDVSYKNWNTHTYMHICNKKSP